MQKVADERSLVTKADFVKLGQDMKLLDFGGAMGEKRKPQSPRMERTRRGSRGKEKEKVIFGLPTKLLHLFYLQPPGGLFLICCCQADTIASPVEVKVDRVMKAFMIWDTDGDGFLSWEEFQQVSCYKHF